MKHKKRWAELTETDENEDGVVEDVVVRSEIVVQAELIAELEHKLKQALENVRRADVVRALEEISQLNTALQARVDDLKAKNALLISSSKVPATRPDTPSAKEPVDTEKGSVKAEIQNADRLQKEHRRMRKDLAAAIQSKENAKARLEKSEKERETWIRTNSRLAKQSAEKDEMNAKSLSTILHLKSVTEKLTQENELFEQQIKSAGQVNLAARLAANAKERVTDEAFSIQRELEEKIALLERECETVKAEYEIAVGSLEKKKAEMSDLERDAATAKERCDELVAEITKQEADKRKIWRTLPSLSVKQATRRRQSPDCVIRAVAMGMTQYSHRSSFRLKSPCSRAVWLARSATIEIRAALSSDVGTCSASIAWMKISRIEIASALPVDSVLIQKMWRTSGYSGLTYKEMTAEMCPHPSPLILKSVSCFQWCFSPHPTW
ncbi:hypothetical protein MHU86_5051 [Fragilaria crotonensis]|nr:hypothetical protein MHU86_5051 [Fragilaria crotonensis]